MSYANDNKEDVFALEKNRASAKHSVAQSWASRRNTSMSTSSETIRTRKNPTNAFAQTRSKPKPPPSPVCIFLKNAWEHTSSWVRLQQEQQQIKLYPKESHKGKPRKERSQKTYFESLTRHQIAKAIASQVETLQEENSLLMSVLPAGYDIHKAVQSSSLNRKRAFMMLDLAAIVTSSVELKAQLPKQTEMQFTVSLNRDPALLELLCRLGISLRCNSNHDVVAAKMALGKTKGGKLVDHVGVTRKPDGFLRRMARACSNNPAFAVDGPDEIYRIEATLERMTDRQNKKETDTTIQVPTTIKNETKTETENRFILRLPADTTRWNDLVHETHSAARSCNAALQGVSIHLEYYEGHSLETVAETLGNVFKQLNELDVNSSLESFRVDLTGLPKKGGDGRGREVDQWMKDLKKNLPDAVMLTVDVSHLLVAHAGALCTRVIGVKRLFVDKEEEKTDNTTTVHYYIDDGCYGSLQTNGNGSNSKEFHPVPLLFDFSSSDKWNEQKQLDDDASPLQTMTSTVWGPTCDGLDRVCRAVQLPPLEVDDWLVFPCLGCGGFGGGLGLGTAFNGFDPPDTAYCVLGYFR